MAGRKAVRRESSRSEAALGRELLAVASWVAGVFGALSLATAWRGPDGNLGGRLGQALADLLLPALGTAAALPVIGLLALAVAAYRDRLEWWNVRRLSWGVAATLAAAALLALLGSDQGPTASSPLGGWVGGWLATLLLERMGQGYAVGLTLFVLALTLSGATGGIRIELVRAAGARIRNLPGEVAARLFRRRKRSSQDNAHSVTEDSDTADALAAQPLSSPAEAEDEAPERPSIVLSGGDGPPGRNARRRRTGAVVQDELPFASGGFEIPPLRFLDPPRPRESRVDEEALWKSSRILEAKLADFGIQGKVVEVRPGPVITTFDIEPAPGVKVNRIVSLADDLAMALRVPGVRILAPVPGRAVVGIEVANAQREEVRLRELLEDDGFARSTSPLTLALGKDTAGMPVFGDLARMPHLLVAGATGSGKSVALNAMILSILYKAPPARVRFVMIDLKMLELSVYEDIPHLLVPVVTDPKRAVVVLKNIVEQMDERYRLMRRRGVRNIDQYNRIVEEERRARGKRVVELVEPAEDDGEGREEEAVVGPPAEPLPKVVVIIDELADLMMTMGRQVEEPITRLAQKARAAGIHLIVATQRPSVDVITGLIKANFPARISFQTTTRVDSRTIIDQIGAERLLGGGDMLYMPPGTARVQRLQGPFVTEREIERVVEHCRGQGMPQYAFGLLEAPEEEHAATEDDLADELYDHAVRLVVESGQASISWVQRRLRVGYNRAARMIERMEREGIVSPSEGGKPREVLVSKGDPR